ncbi:hypothetical protein [Aeromicrobium fastidiosum]|uniref:Uncharacterized protein n=1 Tax=Aeromicrobium fastidiosum TaxID=52699 RepID=A0A641AR76_9ACTN|nr:hypothetical protein [Aeromicrobium fastidiosum]KAA1380455.1 hypothetical protein ESP62_004555 [Aeromicrobium fastidiosum]MBP2390036.1 hypothetical protein [Aeromicrobium fastidiosum]
MKKPSTIYKLSIVTNVPIGAGVYALARQWFGEDAGTITAALVAVFALAIALIPVTTPPVTKDPEAAYREVVTRRIMGNAHLAAMLAGAGLVDSLWPAAGSDDPWGDAVAPLLWAVIPLGIIVLLVTLCTVPVIQLIAKRKGH